LPDVLKWETGGREGDAQYEGEKSERGGRRNHRRKEETAKRDEKMLRKLTHSQGKGSEK